MFYQQKSIISTLKFFKKHLLQSNFVHFSVFFSAGQLVFPTTVHSLWMGTGGFTFPHHTVEIVQNICDSFYTVKLEHSTVTRRKYFGVEGGAQFSDI